MATTKIKGGASTGAMSNMHAGMTRKNPPGVDKSMSCGKGSVNQDATRSGTAPTPKTLGPRDA